MNKTIASIEVKTKTTVVTSLFKELQKVIREEKKAYSSINSDNWYIDLSFEPKFGIKFIKINRLALDKNPNLMIVTNLLKDDKKSITRENILPKYKEYIEWLE